MMVNVCPSGIAAAPAERLWQLLTTTERFGEWQDAQVLGIHPRGRAHPGQRLELAAPAFGRRWPVSIDVQGVDAERRWIELEVRLPFGIKNHERVAVTELEAGRTLVRFN